jgi:cytochrome P450 family 9
MWNRQLLKLTGDEWREVRSTFSPIFTSGKMKMMVQFMHATAKEMADEMGKAAETDSELDMKDLCKKFSMETIASCAFGVSAQGGVSPM